MATDPQERITQLAPIIGPRNTADSAFYVIRQILIDKGIVDANEFDQRLMDRMEEVAKPYIGGGE